MYYVLLLLNVVLQVLYLKNLHPRVSADDLRALFGSGPQIRLLTGRMRGQAFLEFDCKYCLSNCAIINIP